MIDLSKAKKVKNNIVTRGEDSNHSHIAVGEVEVMELDGEIYLDVKGEAYIKHLLEKMFVKEGKEIWTGEHKDIKIEPGVYKYVSQIEYDEFTDSIQEVAD